MEDEAIRFPGATHSSQHHHGIAVDVQTNAAKSTALHRTVHMMSEPRRKTSLDQKIPPSKPQVARERDRVHVQDGVAIMRKKISESGELAFLLWRVLLGWWTPEMVLRSR
eukprot:SAG31_NODE_1106_length_9878_cov_4.621331_6_plen_110_part_00